MKTTATKKKSTAKSKSNTKTKATGKRSSPKGLKKKTSQKVLSAAAQIQKTTMRIVDDMFLKILGSKVLDRAQEVAKSLQKEKKGKRSK